MRILLKDIGVLALLLVSSFTFESQGAENIAGFTAPYAEWKAEYSMSAFSPIEDKTILDAVRAGECGFADFALFMYGKVHTPNSIAYTDKEVVRFGKSVDPLVRLCFAMKR